MATTTEDYLTAVQPMTNGFGFGIRGRAALGAKTLLVYATEADAEEARELLLEALEKVASVEVMP